MLSSVLARARAKFRPAQIPHASRFWFSDDADVSPASGGGRKGRGLRALQRLAVKPATAAAPGSSSFEPAPATDGAPTASTPKWTWGWTPPPSSGAGEDPNARPYYEIPVILNTELIATEVISALEAMDAHDIKKIPIPDQRLDNIEFMIICTGRNPPHMRRMATAMVRALKARNLRNAPGFTGAEGHECDDWILVDCGNMLVHFMDAHSRKWV